ncbi:bifunctional aspartate kinase/homoserine dehydrogenase I, partial [Flavobacteriaceae bacterium]|nr:bifunctional aspartate kinase/homoserine dehydrogenase I [Flavobacteriaceae bacterium]
MKVLKFGGTSVANPQSLTHVIDIINSSKERQVIVVSALGGITNLLVEMAAKASSGVPNYKAHIDTIETRHLELIEYFVPVTQQSEIISFLKSQLNELEEILESLFTLEEATQKSLSKISSYGEILSSTIIFHILKHQDCKVTLKDARSFLFTHTLNDREVVNHELSAKKTIALINNSDDELILVPGFIAQDEEGNTTTLGRGGSDFTASLIANYIDA